MLHSKTIAQVISVEHLDSLEGAKVMFDELLKLPNAECRVEVILQMFGLQQPLPEDSERQQALVSIKRCMENLHKTKGNDNVCQVFIRQIKSAIERLQVYPNFIKTERQIVFWKDIQNRLELLKSEATAKMEGDCETIIANRTHEVLTKFARHIIADVIEDGHLGIIASVISQIESIFRQKELVLPCVVWGSIKDLASLIHYSLLHNRPEAALALLQVIKDDADNILATFNTQDSLKSLIRATFNHRMADGTVYFECVRELLGIITRHKIFKWNNQEDHNKPAHVLLEEIQTSQADVSRSNELKIRIIKLAKLLRNAGIDLSENFEFRRSLLDIARQYEKELFSVENDAYSL